jgi:hypothetical protein
MVIVMSEGDDKISRVLKGDEVGILRVWDDYLLVSTLAIEFSGAVVIYCKKERLSPAYLRTLRSYIISCLSQNDKEL